MSIAGTRQLHSELSVISLAQYSPREITEEDRESKRIMRLVKRGRPETISAAIRYFKTSLRESPHSQIEQVFNSNTVLVPVPASAPKKTGDLWVPLLIAEEMLSQGLAGRVEQLVQRRYPVPKASMQAPENRPTVQTHLDSLQVSDLDLFQMSGRVVLVDDVVTKGRMLMSAANLLRSACPDLEISAFVPLRTVSEGGIETRKSLLEQTIYFDGSDTVRR